MIHLRIVAVGHAAQRALELLSAAPAVTNVIYLRGASRKPAGDVILCDVAREEASLVIGDLKALGIHKNGSIAAEHVDTAISDVAAAAERASHGLPSDAVVWEEVEARTSEQTELSVSFVLFMVSAMQIAAVGIVLDQPILIVGAMVADPSSARSRRSPWRWCAARGRWRAAPCSPWPWGSPRARRPRCSRRWC